MGQNNPTPVSDQEILKQLQNSHSKNEGFKLLIASYQERLYWHIRRIVLHHDDANDVVQNVLVKVFKGVDKFKGNSTLYTWLYRIATNESLTFLTKKKKHVAVSIDSEEFTNSGAALLADDSFDGDAAEKKLKRAMESLPAKQRTVFSMRYFDEVPYQKMSEILETSEGALKASYHHAAKKIEQLLRAVD